METEVNSLMLFVGRWPSRDPIGEGKSVNLYLFSTNNPVYRLDYLGLETIGITSVDWRYYQIIRNHAQNSGDYSGRTHFDLEVDVNSCKLIVIVKFTSSGVVDNNWKSEIESYVERDWSRYKLCCSCSRKLKCEGGLDIKIDIRWEAGGNSDHIYFQDYTVSSNNWHNGINSQWREYELKKVSHEFGHHIGSSDEYGDVYFWDMGGTEKVVRWLYLGTVQ